MFQTTLAEMWYTLAPTVYSMKRFQKYLDVDMDLYMGIDVDMDLDMDIDVDMDMDD